jgi:hypothetical protein
MCQDEDRHSSFGSGADNAIGNVLGGIFKLAHRGRVFFGIVLTFHSPNVNLLTWSTIMIARCKLQFCQARVPT